MSPVRPDVTLIGHRDEPAHYELRDLLTRAAQPHRWLDADSEAGRSALVAAGARPEDLPVIVDGDTVLRSVTPDGILDAWDIRSTPSREAYDVAIVGAGPAGLAAAVYAASDGLSTVVLERDLPGGQASHTSMIENFFGFPEGIGGAELARLAGRQAEGFGAELLIRRGVVGGEHRSDGHRVTLAGGLEIHAPICIAAPGMDWRRLSAPGVEPLLGRGVYYGAGRSEAAQCGGEDVVVIGAGNSAGQAVMNLGNAGARVKMLVRGSALRRTMSAYLVERIERRPADRRPLRPRAGHRGSRNRAARGGHDDGRDAARTGAVRVHRRAAAQRVGPPTRTCARDESRLRADRSRPARGTAVAPATGRSSAIRSRSRPACRGSSPRATCATARRSGWRAPSERARWPSPSRTCDSRSSGVRPR